MPLETRQLPLPHERFAAFRIAIDLAALLHGAKIARGQATLRDQLLRACNSIALNIAEGAGRAGKDRNNFFRIARGSTCETAAALDLLQAAQSISPGVAAEARTHCGRLYALLTKMAGLQ